MATVQGGHFWTPIPQLRGSKLHAELHSPSCFRLAPHFFTVSRRRFQRMIALRATRRNSGERRQRDWLAVGRVSVIRYPLAKAPVSYRAICATGLLLQSRAPVPYKGGLAHWRRGRATVDLPQSFPNCRTVANARLAGISRRSGRNVRSDIHVQLAQRISVRQSKCNCRTVANLETSTT